MQQVLHNEAPRPANNIEVNRSIEVRVQQTGQGQEVASLAGEHGRKANGSDAAPLATGAGLSTQRDAPDYAP